MKEVKELVSFMIEVAHSTDKSFADGKIDANDLVNFLPLLLKAPEALKGSDKIIEEFKAASSISREALINEIKQELNLQNDKLESLIEASLVFANQIMVFAEAVKAMKGK